MCRKLDIAESRQEMPGKAWNVLHWKGAEDLMNRSSVKCRSFS
jgi:hypothetical protein